MQNIIHSSIVTASGTLNTHNCASNLKCNFVSLSIKTLATQLKNCSQDEAMRQRNTFITLNFSIMIFHYTTFNVDFHLAVLYSVQ